MSRLREVIEGHINEFKVNIGIPVKEEIVFKAREKICINCPLKIGNTCNKSKYINPETLEVSLVPKQGYKQGCGCRLSAKQKSPSSSCPAGFWGGEFETN